MEITSKNIIPIQAFSDNYIWTFFDEPSKKAWAVDPGDAKPLLDELNRRGFSLAGIFLTHHHHDHSGGVAELIQHWKNIPIFASHLSRVSRVTNPIKEGNEINCGPFHFRALEIPGHTLDHTAFYGENALFCGDTLFSAGCGRVFEGTPLQMHESLSKLFSLPDQTQIFCGHEYTLANLKFAECVEPNNSDILKKIRDVKLLREKNLSTLPSTLGEEKKINPFLRCDKLEVKKAAEQYAKKNLNNTAEVFTALREWKNNFK